jgi:outer membrane lipoprotein LolB
VRAALWRWALLATALSLSACASLQDSAHSSAAAPAITSGRLALKVQASAERPAQALNAAFELLGNAEQGELRLSSPLGPQIASARWAPGQAVLNTPEGRSQFKTLDELSVRTLGEALPLAALPDWLAGRPWPGAPHQVAHNGFEQLGWLVGLQRFSQGWIDADRAAPPAVSLRVRLDDSRAPTAR